MDKFLVIAITPSEKYHGEAERINQILSNGEAHFVHIRKPNYSAKEIEDIIMKIKPEFHNRLKLHDHFELIDKFSLGGIHLNSRNSLVYPKAKSVSISLHRLEEIQDKDKYDYFFISPVFDSISKKGYKSAFDMMELSKNIQGRNAIALGGVTPQKFPYLKSIGFKGAALLGYFFPHH